MPTMAVSYAPLLRAEIAENNGFTALEQSKTARRQTPFAKCEARWFQPAFVGDTITGVGRVLEKYERRGSKFVTFRIEAQNQRGEPVGRYDYTCIFEYAQGQREVPRDPGTAQPAPNQFAHGEPVEPRPSQLLTFDSAQVGDTLAELAITESQEIINRKSEFRLAGKPSESNIHNDEEFARQNIFGGTVNAGPATMSYVDQMLELSFPLKAFYNGGQPADASHHPLPLRRYGNLRRRNHRQAGRGRPGPGGVPGQGHQPAGRPGLPGRRGDGVGGLSK